MQGRGIHLAANSIAERRRSDTALFWDELAGHARWYAGLYLVIGTLLVSGVVRSGPGPVRLLLAVAVGTMSATDALGGHAVPLAVVACSVLAALALRRRSGRAVDVLVASLVALACLAVAVPLDLG